MWIFFLQAFEKKTELEKIRERNQKLVNNILPEHVADYFLQHQNKDETVGWMLRHFHICEYYGLSLKPNHGVGFTWLAKKTRETLPLAPSHLVLVFHWLKTHGGNCVKTKLDFVRFMDKFYMICWKNPKRLSFTQSSHELEWNWALNSKNFLIVTNESQVEIIALHDIFLLFCVTGPVQPVVQVRDGHVCFNSKLWRVLLWRSNQRRRKGMHQVLERDHKRFWRGMVKLIVTQEIHDLCTDIHLAL